MIASSSAEFNSPDDVTAGARDPPAKPVALPVLFDNIPAELREGRRFVLWRYELRDGDWTKPPRQPSGHFADTTDPATWSTFAEVEAAYRAGGWDGIGRIHLPEDNVTGADGDHCRDPATGAITGKAAAAVLSLDTYTEVSPSGHGVRAFCHGRKPGRRSKAGHFELYDGLTEKGKAGGRYLTLTGHHLAGTPTTVNDRQTAVDAVYRMVFGDPFAGTATSGNGTGALTDDDIIRLATAAKNGEKFRRLFAGSVAEYGDDDSGADEALCCLIVFYTRDAGQIDRIVRRSGLYREKWERADYRERTITKALALVTETYSPGSGRPADGGPAAGGRAPAEVKLGPFVLKPGRPHQTPSGKIIVPADVYRDAVLVTVVVVTSTVSSLDAPARLLAQLDDDVTATEARKALAEVVGIGRRAVAAKPAKPEGPTLREVVTKAADALQLRHRTAGGKLWSEAQGREISRAEFVTHVPNWLIDAGGAAADAPRDANGGVPRRELLAFVKTELEMVWSDLSETLPRAADSDLGADTEASHKFRELFIRLWTKTQTFEVTHAPEGDRAARASLVSRVESAFAPYRTGDVNPSERETWREIQKGFAAWWRPYQPTAGELAVWLALRWELVGQIGVELPGVTDQPSLVRLGVLAGVLDQSDSVPSITNRGKTRLAVVAPELTTELLDNPARWSPEPDDEGA
jgi:hypothetical protein